MSKTKEAKRPVWRMPDWMEPYRDLFQNTGGNPIEELMNDTGSNLFNNAVRVALIAAVDGQVCLLSRLHTRGLLTSNPEVQKI